MFLIRWIYRLRAVILFSSRRHSPVLDLLHFRRCLPIYNLSINNNCNFLNKFLSKSPLLQYLRKVYSLQTCNVSPSVYFFSLYISATSTGLPPPLPPRRNPPSSRNSSVNYLIPNSQLPPPQTSITGSEECTIKSEILFRTTFISNNLSHYLTRRRSLRIQWTEAVQFQVLIPSFIIFYLILCSSSLYDYLDADLYVPHTIGSARIMRGDLIDLDDPLSSTEDYGTALTVEQVQRAYLFLFSPTENNTMRKQRNPGRDNGHYCKAKGTILSFETCQRFK